MPHCLSNRTAWVFYIDTVAILAQAVASNSSYLVSLHRAMVKTTEVGQEASRLATRGRLEDAAVSGALASLAAQLAFARRSARKMGESSLAVQQVLECIRAGLFFARHPVLDESCEVHVPLLVPASMAQLVADNVQSWKLHAAAQAELGSPVHFAPVATLKAGSRGLRTKLQVATDLVAHQKAATGRHNLPLPRCKGTHLVPAADLSVDSGAEHFEIFSDAEGSTTDESSGVSDHAGCPRSLTTGGVDVQTELSFPEHTLACHVTSSADEMVLRGLAALACSSLDAVSKCRANVGCILQGGGVMPQVLGEAGPIPGVVEPVGLKLKGPPPISVIEAKIALTRFRHAVLIDNARTEARRSKLERRQRCMTTSEGLPPGPCEDDTEVMEAVGLFAGWYDVHKKPTLVRKLMREWFKERLHVLATFEVEVLCKPALLDAPFRRRVGNVYHQIKANC